MAKLTRVPAKVFADSAAANEIGQFGSAVAGSKLETSDVATIQGLSAWLSGWSEALVSGNRYPALQEMNGLLKVLSYQGAYALQEGIAEYDSATTYYIGSIVKKTGTFELYGSLTDNNVGQVLSDTSDWQFLCDLNKIDKTDMPSNSYINLTLNPSGSDYVAPDNGYFSLSMDSINGESFDIENMNNGMKIGQDPYNISASTNVGCFLPVSKGQTVKVTYTTASNPIFRFIFAVKSVL